MFTTYVFPEQDETDVNVRLSKIQCYNALLNIFSLQHYTSALPDSVILASYRLAAAATGGLDQLTGARHPVHVASSAWFGGARRLVLI